MAAAVYLEHYLDSIENLPCELQRSFSLMRDLDSRTEEQKEEIERLASEYVCSARTLSSEERVERLQRVESAYGKCREFSDDKVQLAMQMYEMVDRHIRRLDAELARFENEVKEKLDAGNWDSAEEKGIKKRSGPRDKQVSRGRPKKSSDEDSPKRKKMKNSAETLLAMEPSDVLDMPVDPNEPTYCLCHQVSYGEMIGCDNADCPIEWFHFSCVGLTTKPKGKWYCPRCSPDRKKK